MGFIGFRVAIVTLVAQLGMWPEGDKLNCFKISTPAVMRVRGDQLPVIFGVNGHVM